MAALKGVGKRVFLRKRWEMYTALVVVGLPWAMAIIDFCAMAIIDFLQSVSRD